MCFLSFIYACTSVDKKLGPTINQEKFNKIKWSIKEDNEYPYRDKMLNDLIVTIKLKGLKKKAVIDLLGQPDRINSDYLYYKIAVQRIGFFPIHTKTFVIKLTTDSTVEWRKIHE